MNYIGVSVDEMDVELIEPKRCGDNLRLEVGKINVVLSKTPCSGETSMTRKYVKSLITNVTYVNWVDFPGAFVDNVDLAIVKNVGAMCCHDALLLSHLVERMPAGCHTQP